MMHLFQSGFIYHFIILLFVWSIVFSFIDFIDSNKIANQLAFYLLGIVWLFSTFFICYTLFKTGFYSLITSGEGLYIYVWIVITISLVINRVVKLDYLVFFTNVVAFLVFALSILVPRVGKTALLLNQLKSDLLYIHIGLAFIAYGAFTLSFIFSVMYLFQYQLLKKKKWTVHLRKLGNLSKLEKMVYLCNLIGIPFIITALILGSIWASLRIHSFVWYDPKVVGSFFVLLMYSAFMFLKVRKYLYGRSLSLFNISCFLLLLGNYILLNFYSSFHIWSM
jgi:HemX protein